MNRWSCIAVTRRTGRLRWIGAQLVGQALIPNDVHEADFDLLVLDGWSSLLSRRLVDRVQRDGAAVLVLVNACRPEAESNRLRDLGVSLSLPTSASPEQIIRTRSPSRVATGCFSNGSRC